MAMRKPMVAGNWKMNGSLATARALLQGIVAGATKQEQVDLLVLPPFVYLEKAQIELKNTGVAWGAQNLSREKSGAFTGEISGDMLTDLGCQYVLVGHSERRSLFGEDNETVADKAVAAQVAGLTPIVCVGETLAEYEAEQTFNIVSQQLNAVIMRPSIQLDNFVLAYEPVWAIGTGHTATPEQAQAVQAYLREQVAQRDEAVASQLRILYGGSVKPDNAAGLFAQEDIDGGLIGGASLKASDFLAIADAANH